MSVERAREEILNGPIERTLFRLAGPLIVSNMVQVLYNLADTFWLGKLGRNQLSAPGASWPFIATLMSLGMGFAVAGFAFVTQYIGARDFKRANRSAGALYSLSLLFSIGVAIIGAISTPYILKLMDVSSSVYPYAIKYTLVIFIGIPFAFTYYAFTFLLRAVGDTKTPMVISFFTVGLNMALDPVLIFGLGPFPELGVVGAAIATMFSNSVGSVIGAYYLVTGRKGIKFTIDDLKPDWDFYRRIFRVGLPSAVGQSLNSFGFMILTRIIFQYGTVAFAAYAIANRLTNFMFAIANGIAQAMGTMVGQNIGAKNFERAKRIAERTMLINFGVLTAGTAFIVIFNQPVFKAFINDPEVLHEASLVAKYFLTSLPFFGIFSVATGVFQTAGKTKTSMVLGLIRLWGLRIPLSYLLGLAVGASWGVYLGMGLSNVLSAVIALAWFLRGGWMERIID
ncbi:MATE family efflux transporter [Thermococcus henrietii]|uniref:MATE family efflux transporter n=1 Tax=Thermococcus henrietii TaxID=2016361 RepID=UPI000C07A7EF|nr:MATE family efflux transporter [Thermococcus henrietii]